MFIQAEILTAIVGGIFLVAAGTVTGLLAKRTHQEVTTKELWDRIAQLEARERIRDDYIYELRAALARAGEKVPPFPEELTTTS